MIAALLVGLQALLVLASPAWVVLLLASTASYSDSRGVLEYLEANFPGYMILSRLLFLAILMFSIGLYGKSERRKMSPRLRTMCDISLFIFLVCLGSFIANENGLARGIQDLYFNPVSYFFVYATLFRRTREYLIPFVGIQIALAICVVFVPAFEPFDARDAVALHGGYVGGEAFEGLGSIDFSSVNKVEVGQYAQFQNPNTLGFYAGIALAIGIGQLLSVREAPRTRLLYFALAVGGALCWYSSLTRGPLLAVFIATIAALFLGGRKIFIGVTSFVTAAIVFIAFQEHNFLSGLSEYLLVDRTDISVTDRIVGFANGAAAIIDSPIWGVNDKWDWQSGVPHVLPFQYAAFYGLPSAALLSWALYALPMLTFIKLWRLGLIRESLSTFQIYSVLLAISVTNNAPGTCLFGFAIAYVQMRNEALIATLQVTNGAISKNLPPTHGI